MSSTFEINLLGVELVNANFEIYKREKVDVENASLLEATLNYPKSGVSVVKSLRPIKFKVGDEKIKFEYPNDEKKLKLNEILGMDNIKQMKNEILNLYDEKEFLDDIESIADLRLYVNKLLMAEQFDLGKAELKKLLFKQEFEGVSNLEIAITSTKKADVFEKGLLALIGKGFTTAVGSITGVGAAVTAMGSLITESLFNATNSRDNIIGIAYGYTRFDEVVLNEKLKEVELLEIEVNLFVPEKTEKIIKEYNSFGASTLREKIALLYKGEYAGKAKLAIS